MAVTSNKLNVYVFREFLISTLVPQPCAPPSESPAQSSFKILDVAGGKGDLSWLLSNLASGPCITSTIVDPHNTNFSRKTKSVDYLRSNPNIAKICSDKQLPDTYQPLANLVTQNQIATTFTTPSHLRIRLTPPIIHAFKTELVEGTDGESSNWRAVFNAEQQQTELSESQTKNFILPSSTEGSSDGRTISSAHEAYSALSSADALVCYHGDGAVEPAVELALLLQIPFAVVPCCVLQKQFPNRTLADGTFVRKHHQLVTKLLEMGSRYNETIRHTTLKLNNDTARGDVVFMTADDYKRR